MTPDLAENAFQLAQSLEGEQSLQGIKTRVRAFALPLGYTRFMVMAASAFNEDPIQNIYWAEGDWLGDGSAVRAEDYVRHCPMTRHVVEAREPFFWTKVMDREGECYRVVRMPRGPGQHGLQVPVFGHSGFEGAVSFGGDRIDAAPRTRMALMLVGVAAFHAAHRLLGRVPEEESRSLSDREREVLAWVAAGRRHADIAATLGLSDRTIENHLRRIRKRLGVATTSQAVQVAIRNGEIKA